jgi:predicted secreted protein
MTDAFRSQGTVLEVEESEGAGTFMRIAEMRNMSPSITTDQLDASNHDTPSAWREWVGGMITGNIDLEGNYLPTHESHNGDTGMLKFLQDGLNRKWRMRTPTTPPFQWTFSGIVVEYSPTFVADQLSVWTGRMMISGQPQYAVLS